MKAEILDTKKLLGKPLKVEEVKYRYERFNGKMSDKVSKIIVNRKDAVAAIVYNADTNRYIFARQYRYAAHKKTNPWLIELMAGVIEKGETADQALVRELEEELGYTAVKTEKLFSFHTAPGYSTEQVHLFFVEVNNGSKKGTGGGVAKENEDIQQVTYTIDDIRNVMATNGFGDAKTIIGCNYLLSKHSMVNSYSPAAL